MLQETALELRSQLWKASELISLPQLWYGTATLEEVGNLAKALSDTGEAVVEAWHKSYDRERKAEQERREAVLPKKRAKLSIRDVLAKSKALYEGERKKAHQTEKTALLMISLGDDIIHRLESDLTRARQYIQALSIRISEANAFVRSTREVDASTLTSRGYLTYCSVREVAHRVPDLVQPTCKEQIFFLPGEVFENIRSAILITGSAGHGKTSFCKNYALADSKALVNKDSDVLPVFVRLHHLASRELGSFEEEFFSAPELRALMSKDGDATKVHIGKIRVYLDGLDEVPRLERQRELMELARSAVNADPRVQIVVTGRNYVNGPWLNWMPRVAITELDDNQILELVSSLLGNNDHEIKKFFRELGKVYTLQPLMKVPLLSTLTVLVYKKGTPLPENRIKLYEAFVNLMCGGWDLAKNVPRRVSFGSVVKLSLLTRLAGDMQRKRVRDCKKNSIQAALDSLNPDYSDRFGELLEELLQDGLLTRGGEVYAFCHQSFQEFLAAKELNDPTGRRQKAILRKYFQGDDWWFQTLSFYIASTTKPDDTEYWLRTTKEELQFSNSLANDALDRYRQLIANLVESAPGYSPVSLPVSDYV
jgi:hypothetical protein